MLKRGIALSVGALLSLSVIAPAAADATAGETLYVDNASGSNCSDSGTGMQAEPFCTVQAAANVVNPGQTVQIVGGFYQEAVTISRSGTATAPVTFVGTGNSNNNPTSIVAPDSTSQPSISITGASNLVIKDIGIGATATSNALVISGSSQITVDSDHLGASPGSTGYVEITGDSSSVTFSRNQYGAFGASIGTQPAVQVDPGSKDDTITTNDMDGTGGIQVSGASDVAVTSNTLRGPCGEGVAVTGSSTGVASAWFLVRAEAPPFSR